jgi:prophage antirepressor-like protein
MDIQELFESVRSRHEVGRGIQIRTYNIDGEPWFMGVDVAKMLGFRSPSSAVKSHCYKRRKLQIGTGRPITVINQKDVESLAIRSPYPNAIRENFWREWARDMAWVNSL